MISMTQIQVLARLGVISVTLASTLTAASAQQSSAEIVVRKNVMVPMRDGVKLAQGACCS